MKVKVRQIVYIKKAQKVAKYWQINGRLVFSTFENFSNEIKLAITMFFVRFC